MNKIFLFLLISIFYTTNLKAQVAETPIIDSLTVSLLDSKVGIYWKYTDKASIGGYRIKRRVYAVSGVIDGSFVNIATIADPNQTWFIDTATNYAPTSTDTRQESYVVEAYHFDGVNYEYSNLSDEHKTILLHEIVYDNCANTNALIWNNYYGWGDSIASYEVHFKGPGMLNAGLLVKLSASDTTYIHSNLHSNESYSYFIRALHSNGVATSTSNTQISYTKQPVPPVNMNADYTEVLSESKVKLVFSVDLASEITNFSLQRAENKNGNYETISAVLINSKPFEYIDSIDTQRQYFYKIIALDACGSELKESNVLSNIVLKQQLDANEFGLVNLNWTNYFEYEAGLQTYKISRQVGTNIAEELTQTLDTFYSDAAGTLINDMIASGNFSGNICYYIEAVENIGNSAGVQGLSKSNLSCIALQPQVFVPNAFNPQSYIEKNNSFKPYVSFAKTYKMLIISRWGNVVFETDDINEAWDGRINGDYAREGTYIYVIKITAPNDEYYEKSGNITVFY